MPKVLVLRDTLIALACSLPAAHADSIPNQTSTLVSSGLQPLFPRILRTPFKVRDLLLGYGGPARSHN
jgi:hypothetical protein